MLTANVHEVKTKFSHYLSLVQKGKRIIIAKRNIPIAEIKPIEADSPQRLIGQSKEKFEVPDDFFKPLSKDIIDAFNNPK
ncbi:MAG: Prevent-host-death family protein [Microgenomates group bacterium GW2011_GWC1_37_8]|uniref:Prevent-host-death family protein n=2 Tax=Candidatus Woeseibacteriota TaxID=1752722 RepID=A0A0G0KZB5_9BACT|nr:MAG: Prevent-host-death family protein [Microgenomates group bacterium GW2011_GWC1_37_8]KKQ85028.1 MAG: Prevent-host-death family protein [Candidatus Woesebacteria bacterium GW2011_GWB1_38_8]OGM21875.1 MAG: hypothetical protein A2863_00995 [Candidatus Woesebacteria bacterium RIFCSPHIGHO2_01_FULL_38_9b]